MFSFPAATKMFQFTAYASAVADDESSTHRVVPFGNPGLKGHLHLNRAYRSLSRPSSPPRAKASPIRPLLLSLFLVYFHRLELFGSIYFEFCLVARF